MCNDRIFSQLESNNAKLIRGYLNYEHANSIKIISQLFLSISIITVTSIDYIFFLCGIVFLRKFSSFPRTCFGSERRKLPVYEIVFILSNTFTLLSAHCIQQTVISVQK